ncbi:MAG: hypothetical protein AB7J13_11670, partial [Pyrinomonadaceae bacterium]
IGVLVGSGSILLIAVIFSRWLDARTARQNLLVGGLWVGLTVLFEIGLGIATGASPERIAEDYDLADGGLMPLGLVFMLFAPWLASRIRG